MFFFFSFSSFAVESTQYYDVIQESGDIMFVPSLWHHQVANLEDTISINHNWFNAFNIDIVFDVLSQALIDVEKELNDCKADSTNEEWREMCQKVLKANHGLDFKDFVELLHYISSKRIKSLKNPEKKCRALNGKFLGKNHAKYDLMVVKNLLKRNLCCIEKNLTEEDRNIPISILHEIDAML